MPPCCGANQAPVTRCTSLNAEPKPDRSPSTKAGRSFISTVWATRSTSRSGGGGNWSNAAASASPLKPGLPGGIAMTQRQVSGTS